MRKKVVSILTSSALTASLFVPFSNEVVAEASTPVNKGKLVIAGGALGATNANLYNKFIELAGSKADVKVGIVPIASGSLKSSNTFKKDLASYGVPESNIEILPLAYRDFSDTKNVNEKEAWAGNQNNENLAQKVKDLDAIWFVGGDQLRITSLLYNENGSNSKVLDAIWHMYRDGGVIGGTSAGAAIMSDVMITGGDSLGAFKEGFVFEDVGGKSPEYSPVYIEKGLGFFEHGIVDQHLDERGRVGRLAATAIQFEKEKEQNFAYGVDEDTAMVVNNETNTIEVVGRSGLAVLDVSKATVKDTIAQSGAKDIRVSYLAPGDTVNISTKSISFRKGKYDTKGFEYFNFTPQPATGIMTPYGKFKNYLSYSLVDNTATEVKSYVYDSKGDGFELSFREDALTNGYWGQVDGQRDDYSIYNVIMDVTPRKVTTKANTRATRNYKKPSLTVPKNPYTTGEINGNLVIAGGSLGSSNTEVYNRFIEAAGGIENAKIGIIPAASGNFKSTNIFRNDLVKYGVKPENIQLLKLSSKKLSQTAWDGSIWDESWNANMNNPTVVDQVKGLTGVWFVGGDQTKITAALRDKEGNDSTVLKEIWNIYKNGAVLGGTSAGAAIMSDVMLAGGDSLNTLRSGFVDAYEGMSQQEGGAGYLERGLGFFQYGIIDQHFDNKARLGRLIATAHEKGNKKQFAYGIDEDTALFVNNKTKTIEPIGRAGVTVIDLSKTKTNKGFASKYSNVLLSYLKQGDSIDVATKTFTISDTKDTTTGYEYGYYEAAPSSGVLTSHGTFANYISYSLVDNEKEKSVVSYVFDDKKTGFQLKLYKNKTTEGYWGYTDGQRDDYSFTNVSLDINPISVSIK